MLLALDTSTHSSSIALYDERGIVGETTWRSHENHTRSLMPQIVRLLEVVGVTVQDLTVISTATGPGSFTGLRIGLSAAKGLAYSLHISLIGIPTLDITASVLADQPNPVCAILQAGRGRFGAGMYENQNGSMQRRGDYFFGTPQEIAAHARETFTQSQVLMVIGEMDAEVRAQFRAQFFDTAVLVREELCVRRAGFLAALAWRRWQDNRVDDMQALAPYYIPTPSVN